MGSTCHSKSPPPSAIYGLGALERPFGLYRREEWIGFDHRHPRSRSPPSARHKSPSRSHGRTHAATIVFHREPSSLVTIGVGAPVELDGDAVFEGVRRFPQLFPFRSF